MSETDELERDANEEEIVRARLREVGERLAETEAENVSLARQLEEAKGACERIAGELSMGVTVDRMVELQDELLSLARLSVEGEKQR